MGRVQSVEYFSLTTEGCSEFEIRKMPCCDDVLEYLVIEDDHNTEQFSKSFQNIIVLITPVYLLLEFERLINVTDESSFADLPDPPELFSDPIYIITHQFTFYG